MSQSFYSYGKFCASHPWEVIVAFLTLSICIFSMGPKDVLVCDQTSPNCQMKETLSGDAVVIILARCLAVLYVYHQFRTLYKIGSNYLVGIAALFTVFSSFIFSSGVINFINGDFSELNTAMPLFLLLADLPKASLLAQFALSSSTREEVRKNIARGMSILGPSLTLDTMVETLAIGVGTLSGVNRVEHMSYLACLSVVVNYIIFMTFFPACLSLALELSHSREGTPVWQLSSFTKVLQKESEQAPNPVIQRVKVIMSAGLTLVHTLSRWQLDNTTPSRQSNSSDRETITNSFYSKDEVEFYESQFRKYFVVGYEQLVMVGLVLALAIKYIFFDSNDNENLIAAAHSENNRKMKDPTKSKDNDNPTISIIPPSQDSDTESVIESKSKNRGSPKRFFIGDDNSSDCSDDNVELAHKNIQTTESNIAEALAPFKPVNAEPRPIDVLVSLLNSEDGVKELTDGEVIALVNHKRLQAYRLEAALNDPTRGVHVRRLLLAQNDSRAKELVNLPFLGYDYSLVLGACCENVVGYMPIPVGVAGPMLLAGLNVHIPMATTEGCLVASTNRGCRAISMAGGARSCVVGDGMTRGPVVRFPSAVRAAEALEWLNQPTNFALIKEAFDSTSRFARLVDIQPRIAAKYLFIRLISKTGDAMGMNMLSKGSELALGKLKNVFTDMEIISLSGNVCTDKKPSAINWIEGRGKSVVCEAVIPARIVQDVLKTDVKSLVDLNISKNLIGSAMAGSIGGFNAHAANIVTAIYLATGQDPAQNVGSSNCITITEACGENDRDLYISCTMPSIEVGTVGGGTILPAQASCLELLGVRGSCVEELGRNAKQLARVVCASVLAGELSILSALAAGHLVRSHMKHNRSNVNINTPQAQPPSNQLFATSCKQL